MSTEPHAPDPPPPVEQPRAFSLWRNRDYLILWSGQVVSALGGGVSNIALPLLVLAVTHSPIQAGLVGAFAGLPYPLFGLVAGVLVDRWDRKLVMMACDAVNALAMLSLAAAVAFGSVPTVQFYIVAFVTGTAFVFFSLAEISAIPSIVTTEQLPTAMAQNQAVGSGTAIISGPIGGVLFQVARAVPFLMDGVSFVGSVISMAFVRTKFQGERSGEPRNIGAELMEGLRWVFGDRKMRDLAIVVAVWQLFNSFGFLTIIILARSHGASPAQIGVIEAGGAVGGLLGAVSSPAATRRFAAGRTFLMALLAATLMWPFYVIAPNLILIGVLNAIVQFCIPIGNTAIVTYRAAQIPNRLQGRVIGAYRVFVWGIIPVGTAIGGFSLQRFGVTPTLWTIFGGNCAVCAIAFGLKSVRNARIASVPTPSSA